MTATINRSQIFKNAWNFVRTLALSISEALKQAWAEAKNGIGAMAVVTPAETEAQIEERLASQIVCGKGNFTHRGNEPQAINRKYIVSGNYAMDADERFYSTIEEYGKIYLNEFIDLYKGTRQQLTRKPMNQLVSFN